MFGNLFKKKQEVIQDPVVEVMQTHKFMSAKDARMFTKFRAGDSFIPMFKNMTVDELVNDVLKTVDKFTKRSQLTPVESANIVYTADILRSLSMEFRVGKRYSAEYDRVAEHYADCRTTVMCAIEVLERLGYAVRVISMSEGSVKTSVLSIHW
ncbi:hypothetical protein COD17_09235 [Bacillus thuringiensis]|nr:hypothetical protein COD17_09235 [Bacillus thuringiensis]